METTPATSLDPDVLDVGAADQLFVTDTVLAATTGLRKRVHQMTKVGPGPVWYLSDRRRPHGRSIGNDGDPEHNASG